MSKKNSDLSGNNEKGPVSVKCDKTDGKNRFSIDIPADQFLSEIKRLTGTESGELAEDLIGWAAGTMPSQSDGVHNINSILHVLWDSEPQDSTEAKLCLQSHSLYVQGMEYLARANSSKIPSNSQMYMNFAVKLLRLNNETVEALNRYRRGGEQRVTVQHVNVENGGQAIVGNVQAGGGGKYGNRGG